MKKLLLFLLLPFLSYGQVQIGNDIDGIGEGDGTGRSIGLNMSGDFLAVYGRGNDNAGQVRFFENQSGTWVQVSIINGSQSLAFAGFGLDLSSNGDIVAIASVNLGIVQVFENDNNNWIQIGEDIEESLPVSGFFGTILRLSSEGNILAIANPYDNTANGNMSGKVQVYENQGGNWVQVGQDFDGLSFQDFLGTGLDLSSDGNILAFGNSSLNGRVSVFENSGGVWLQIGEDIIGEYIGRSVKLSSDGNILVTSKTVEDVRRVVVYQNQNDDWVQMGGDIFGDPSSAQFGENMSISSNGNILVVGDTSQNATWIYQYVNENWVQIGDIINGESDGDSSGLGIDLSANGEILAIGARLNDGNGDNSGHVRVFDISNEILSTQQPIKSKPSLYPNPTNTNFTITLSDLDTLQKATIYNSLGQEVLTSTRTTIDVSSLSKGVYVVEVQTSTGKGSEKLIIQ